MSGIKIRKPVYVLEVWMQFTGYNGGTIHQCYRDFDRWDSNKQQQFIDECKRYNVLDKFHVKELEGKIK